ncbi:hypothetical protein EJ04DRAFT_434943 [Polyplosphaeria fusca]|uniref:RING-type domain-containing protein n=1 Tax=Polyplosphaeria fusca TaxID=682080 RepID=A0A9P4QWZ3_9PLEO|nr:hypothetical protein EJ04DRAFT_434943 [Polyplosphaeria fusca]
MDDFYDLDTPSDIGNAFDLAGIEHVPDIDIPPDAPAIVPKLNETECLQVILNVLPDIAVDHVLSLIRERGVSSLETCQALIDRIFEDGPYPTESQASQRKRKREDDNNFEKGEHVSKTPDYFSEALELLKDRYIDIPVRHLEKTLRHDKTLWTTVLTIEEQLLNYNRKPRPFSKISRARAFRHSEAELRNSRFDQGLLIQELDAVRKRVEMDRAKRRKIEEAKRAEEMNLMQAQVNGEMNECLCCYDEFPSNRMTYCDGDVLHFLCLTCASKAVEAEMSLGRCRPSCFADTACHGTYNRRQLMEFLDEGSFERLERMQQQEDLIAAGLDLDECPFCDFKMQCPPLSIDKEFRCLNPGCRKISCRMCQKESHIPKSCAEAKKEANFTVRHQVEEAMTDALIRKCNQCKNPFVKESGCNKMRCSKCNNLQCYVCSEDIKDYNHFGDTHTTGRCPLHDNVEQRHETEVKKAEAEARARVRAENPDIPEEDLMVEVSESVQRAEADRRGLAQRAHADFPFYMQGQNLVRNPVPPPPLYPGAAVHAALNPAPFNGAMAQLRPEWHLAPLK